MRSNESSDYHFLIAPLAEAGCATSALASTSLVTSRAFILLVTAALCGCGGQESSQIRGSIAFQGRPLPGGAVNFHCRENGAAITARIDERGQFEANGAFIPGDYVVYVTPPTPAMPIAEDTSSTRPLRLNLSSFPKIPVKFRSQITSDLTVQIKSGDNDLTLEIPE
ncbi:MAG TPA: hypothetical protein PKC18_01615 [Lacipirellulaceae bacterium]|nr:hypothetical protein [Lacipirellulaceae bacterium]